MKHPHTGFFHALRFFLLALLAAGFGSNAQAAPKVVTGTYAGNPQADAFSEEMVQRGLDPQWVRQALYEAKKLESVIQAVRPAPAGQRKNWQAYRERFVEPRRTEAGRVFMQQYAETLKRATNQFGVPEDVILGILGVETFYGRHTGRYRVVDALATLAFDYPAEEGKDRSAYFRGQLAHFFIWCANEQCQPLNVTGSYAGAMGMPQFMPENIQRYGADFDGDGHVDLNNPVDAIGSVARFLALHGWVRELGPVFPVDIAGAQLAPLLAPDILPTFTFDQLAGYGAQPLAPLPQGEKYALVELQNGDSVSDYVLGSRNFYALTRYNRSSYYAMAVLLLGQRVAAQAAGAAEPTPQAANFIAPKSEAASGCSQC